jgi:hypothetical protein
MQRVLCMAAYGTSGLDQSMHVIQSRFPSNVTRHNVVAVATTKEFAQVLLQLTFKVMHNKGPLNPKPMGNKHVHVLKTGKSRP